MSSCHLMLATLACAALASDAEAQEAAIFRALEGSWLGQGSLLDRRAEFQMRWELRPGDVALLTFANAFRDSAGSRTPVLDAAAVYHTGVDRPEARWEDSRGTSIAIRWEATDTTLTSHWTGGGEEGRTVYRLTDGMLDVTDHVRSAGDWRVFGTATYRRGSGQLPEPDPALAPLSWLSGCWRIGGGETVQEERWSPPAGDAMVGTSRTVRGGRLTAFEHLRIQVIDGRPTYVAKPSGQPEAAFPLVALTDSSVVFEDPGHDFPQRIGYDRVTPDRLLGWIEGTRDGEVRRVPFPLVRAGCER